MLGLIDKPAFFELDDTLAIHLGITYKAHKIQLKMLKCTGILYSGELVIIHDCILILCFQLDFGFKFSIFKFKFIATCITQKKRKKV